MNILPITLSNGISVLEQSLRHPLTYQQKKIIVVALAVLAVASIVACYLFQCLCFKAKPLNGPGELTKAGNVFKGNFKEGKLQGQGTITEPNGTVHQGEFKDDLFEGPGKLIAKDGSVMVEGKFVNGKLEGAAKIKCADETKYEGNFHEGQPHGACICKDANGETYDGQWQNGKRHGKGKITDKAGKVTDVEYVEGKLKTEATNAPESK